MTDMNAANWVTFVDREGDRLIALSAFTPDRFRLVVVDEEDSVPGSYTVWRQRRAPAGVPLEPNAPKGEVVCVEIRLNHGLEPQDFPEAILPAEVVRRSDLLTLWSVDSSFAWWTPPGGGSREHEPGDSLDRSVERFVVGLHHFDGFSRRMYRVSELLDNPSWDWGHEHGVYCFVSEEHDVYYVGRALGSTLGERIWDQLHSLEYADWARVVQSPDTLVRVFSVQPRMACLVSSLEAFLISQLNPPFNRRCQ